LKHAAQAMGGGFSSLKIKISPAIMRFLDPALAELLSLAAGPLFFRLDANSSFTKESFDKLLESLSSRVSSAIEYIEDPYPNFWEQGERRVSLAVDVGAAALLKKEALGNFVYVVKPTVELGLLALAKEMGSRKQKIVLSSALETEVGLCTLRNFALSYGDSTFAHGLATAHFFEKSFLRDVPLLKEREVMSPQMLRFLDAHAWRAL
jgi:O-succinylbenzoate synthase